MPNWVAGMADQEQYVLRTSRGQQNRKCDLSALAAEDGRVLMFAFNRLILVSVKLAEGRAIGLISFVTISSQF